MLEFAMVRSAIILLLTAVLSASADTIYLKNGRTIVADSAREEGGRVQYQVGDNTFAIPKSLVERIEAGGASAGLPGAGAAHGSLSPDTSPPLTDTTLPAFAPEVNIAGGEAVSLRVVHDGRVDREALAALESAGKPELAAAGFFVAGRHEYERGDRERARYYLERALMFAPQNPVVLTQYAVVLVQLGRAREAIPYAERAARLAPNSPDAFLVLGYAYFSADRGKDAIPAWQRSLELRPDETVKKLLAKAQREVATEENFSETETGHFTFRYEGASTSPALRRQIQAALEADYLDLVNELGVAPRANIPVILYTEQAFFDVTEAPTWIGALYDGKLRIPIQGLTAVTPALARVLRHELTHSFIAQITGGRCPQWLNEGIAQLLEPKSVAPHGRRLAQFYQAQHVIPLNELEGSFMNFSGLEAVLAYDQSLAAAEYIRDTYGMAELRSILERIGQGSSTESALRATIHSGYADLQQDLTQYLAKKYGN
jgi:tetratricopeptide (TPR) repeat protein